MSGFARALFALSGAGGSSDTPDSDTPPIPRPLPEPAGCVLDLWASPRTELWIG
jgi:hypothetical protein